MHEPHTQHVIMSTLLVEECKKCPTPCKPTHWVQTAIGIKPMCNPQPDCTTQDIELREPYV